MSKILSFFVVLLFPISVFGAEPDLLLRDGAGNTVRLHDKPCLAKSVTKHLQGAQARAMRAATVVYMGRTLKACWIPIPQQGVVGIVDEEGDFYPLPMHGFEKVVHI